MPAAKADPGRTRRAARPEHPSRADLQRGVTDWRTRAARRHTDHELFFPECTAGPVIDRAKQICDGCPVRARCLDWALSRGAVLGIWGGRTEAERLAMGAVPAQPVRRAWHWSPRWPR